MLVAEDSYEVIILYLLEIDYYWQNFLGYLAKNCSPNLMFQIIKISSDKKLSYDLYLEALADIKGGVSIFLSDNNFRLKFIHNRIFRGLGREYIENLGDMCRVMIEVENRTISFFKEHFGSLPYSKTKELLVKIINEKEKQIEMLRAFEA